MLVLLPPFTWFPIDALILSILLITLLVINTVCKKKKYLSHTKNILFLPKLNYALNMFIHILSYVYFLEKKLLVLLLFVVFIAISDIIP